MSSKKSIPHNIFYILNIIVMYNKAVPKSQVIVIIKPLINYNFREYLVIPSILTNIKI